MRKVTILFFVFALTLGGVSRTSYATDCTKDTSIDRVGDWFGTFGKKGAEKDKILAQRKADRIVACGKREAEKVMTEAQKAGNDMKRKFGF